MATNALTDFFRRLARGMAAATLADHSDRQLVSRALAERDEAAFQAIVNRHGPMVYRVCWRVLRHSQDAEDAFQATFLIFAQKLHTIRKHHSVASWLHGIAHRVALKSKTQSAARRSRERKASTSDVHLADDVTWRELRSALDFELSKLPERWRQPLILCYLEGRTQDESASQLGWSKSTFRRRLDEARNALCGRLNGRGIAGPAALSAVLLSDCIGSASPGASLVATTVESTAVVAAGAPVTTVASTKVAALTQGVLKAMFLSKVKSTAAMFLAFVASAGLGGLCYTTLATEGAQERVATASAAPIGKAAQPGPAGDEPVHFLPQAMHVQPLPAAALSLAFTPDGKTLAAARGFWGPPGQLQLWDMTTRKLRACIDEQLSMRSLAISKDGKVLLTACQYDGTAKVRDPQTGAVRMVLPGHNGRINHVAVTADAKLAATAGIEDGIVKIWDLATGKELHRLKGHTTAKEPGKHDGLYAVAFSPDGRTLASSGSSKTPRLWDVASGQEKFALEGHGGPIEHLAFSPDSKTLATVSYDRSIKLWNVANGNETATLLGHLSAVMCVTFSPDGKLLASGSGNHGAGGGELKLWDLASRTEVMSSRSHPDTVWSVAFSPDSKLLASGSWDKTIRLWDVDARVELPPLDPVADPQPILAMARSPDGKHLAIAGEDGSLQVLDAAFAQPRYVLKGHRDIVTCLAFSPDSATLATAGPDKTVKLWDMATGKDRLTLTGHTSWIYSLAYSPDGTFLASGSYDKNVHLWDPATGKQQAQLIGHSGSVRALAVSPDGATIVSGGNDQTIRVWDARTRRERIALRGHEGAIRALAFSADGRILASAGEDAAVKLWNAASGNERTTLKGHEAEVWALAFSPGGKILATGDSARNLFLWDPETGQQRAKLLGHQSGVSGLAFSPDGRELISSSLDKRLKRWRANSDLVALFKGHTGPVNSAVFSPDGVHVLSISAGPPGDGTIRLWDAATAKELRRFEPKTPLLAMGVKEKAGEVYSAAFSPDGRSALSAGVGNAVVLWDVVGGSEIRRFDGHTAPVYAACFTPDGRFVLSAGRDETIRRWDVITGKEVARFDGQPGKVKSAAFSPDGRRLLLGGIDKTVRLWDVDAGRELFVFEDNSSSIRAVAFSPDGRRGIAAMREMMRLWDLETGKEIRRFEGNDGVTTLALSADGRFLLSGGPQPGIVGRGSTKELRLWDAQSGTEVRRFHFHDLPQSLTFSTDGRRFLSAGGRVIPKGESDFSIRLWEMPKDQTAVARP